MRSALEWARALAADGLSQREIADRLGINRRTVARMLGSGEPPHYRRAPLEQRVDFVLFASRRKCVIEIDGPSHYATFDEVKRRYNVSEERYTRNLRIERSLRRQGWEIHRFSNYEINNAEPDDFKKLVGNFGVERSALDYGRIRKQLSTYDPDNPNYIPF